jgi:hypothetical protein
MRFTAFPENSGVKPRERIAGFIVVGGGLTKRPQECAERFDRNRALFTRLPPSEINAGL